MEKVRKGALLLLLLFTFQLTCLFCSRGNLSQLQCMLMFKPHAHLCKVLPACLCLFWKVELDSHCCQKNSTLPVDINVVFGVFLIWANSGTDRSFKNVELVIHAFSPSTWEANKGGQMSEFKASLIYRESSRSARATQRNPVKKM